MKPPALPPRLNKKQVTAYLAPEDHASFTEFIHRKGITCQEGVARAINAALERHGRTERLPEGHLRLVRRNAGLARPRPAGAARSRQGRILVGGWYAVECVDAVSAALASLGLGMQGAISLGLPALVGEDAKVRQKENSAEDAQKPVAALADELSGFALPDAGDIEGMLHEMEGLQAL
ncbi:hypothetical protein ACTVH1_18450 [Gluconobacter cerinus]